MKAKLITAAALTLAGMGAIASQNTAERRSSAGSEPEAASRIGPAPASVESPLVEKLLVKEKPAGPADGQLTADGFFKFDASRRAWVPVDHGHPRYLHNKGRVGLEHLIAEHGHARSSAEKWTQEELEIAHANSHWWEKTHSQKISFQPETVSQMSSSCPGGQCGNPSRSRGLFGRRR